MTEVPINFISAPILTSVTPSVIYSSQCENVTLYLSGDFFTVDLSFSLQNKPMNCTVVSESAVTCFASVSNCHSEFTQLITTHYVNPIVQTSAISFTSGATLTVESEPNFSAARYIPVTVVSTG